MKKNCSKALAPIVGAALVALYVASVEWIPARPAPGQENTPVARRGMSALDQLERDRQFDSLKTSMNQARFGVSRLENTTLGRPAWRAPNPTRISVR